MCLVKVDGFCKVCWFGFVEMILVVFEISVRNMDMLLFMI